MCSIWLAQDGLAGRVRGRRRRTTVPGDVGARPADLVDRQFRASAQDELWIADITYVATRSGFAYTASVTDVSRRRIVGRRVSSTSRTDLALTRSRWRSAPGAISHSTSWCTTAIEPGQYPSIRCTERFAAEGAITSVGSRGDDAASYV